MNITTKIDAVRNFPHERPRSFPPLVLRLAGKVTATRKATCEKVTAIRRRHTEICHEPILIETWYELVWMHRLDCEVWKNRKTNEKSLTKKHHSVIWHGPNAAGYLNFLKITTKYILHWSELNRCDPGTPEIADWKSFTSSSISLSHFSLQSSSNASAFLDRDFLLHVFWFFTNSFHVSSKVFFSTSRDSLNPFTLSVAICSAGPDASVELLGKRLGAD